MNKKEKHMYKEEDWWKDFKEFMRIIDLNGQLRVAFGRSAVIIPKSMMDAIFSFLTENHKDLPKEDKSLALEMISLYLQTPTLELEKERKHEKMAYELRNWLLDEKVEKMKREAEEKKKG